MYQPPQLSLIVKLCKVCFGTLNILKFHPCHSWKLKFWQKNNITPYNGLHLRTYPYYINDIPLYLEQLFFSFNNGHYLSMISATTFGDIALTCARYVEYQGTIHLFRMENEDQSVRSTTMNNMYRLIIFVLLFLQSSDTPKTVFILPEEVILFRFVLLPSKNSVSIDILFALFTHHDIKRGDVFQVILPYR